MSLSRFILFLHIILFFNISFSQTKNIDSLDRSYQSYFELPRESVYVHLNKTSFLTGEEIWWSAYLYNRKTNLPSSQTTNLYFGLYDQNGKQLQKQLFYVENGRSKGNFLIDSKFKSGTYYIKAGTNWMKNFKDEKEFVQKITIINKSVPLVEKITPIFDLQLLPEGGHLIENLNNVVGVKITNQNSKGIKIVKGEVFNANNQLVKSFSNNYYGVGKFDLFIEKKQTYTVKVTLDDGQELTKPLTLAKEKGIALSVNNILKDKLVISLKTNSTTLDQIKKEKFYLAIHRDGLMTLNEFSFKELEKNINIARNKLHSDTNIITLFNKDLHPISERLIFNYVNTNLAEVIIEKPVLKIKDSISLKINVFSKNNSPASLNITALPTETIANNPKSNIIATFLLEPYLKGTIQNPSYYFNKKNRKRDFELDLILLTQGWSKYKWKDIFNSIPRITYPIEKGISVTGKIENTKIKQGDELAIHTGNFSSLFYMNLNENKNFNINSIFLQNNDTLNFAIKNKKGKLRKPNLDITFNTTLNTIDSIQPNLLNSLPTVYDIDKKQIENLSDLKDLIFEEIVELDEVIITEEKIEKKLTRNRQLIGSVLFNAFKIDENTVKKNPLLSDFISKNGFLVTIANSAVFVVNPRPLSGPVQIFINDIVIRDNTELFNLELRQIDEIYINPDGVGEGPNASGGVIRIYRKSAVQLNSFTSRFAQQLAINSFTRPKQFYRPKYNSFASKDFSNYGVIHWESNLQTNSDGSTILKIPLDTPNVKLFIEGMGNDGTLISHIQNITLEP